MNEKLFVDMWLTSTHDSDNYTKLDTDDLTKNLYSDLNLKMYLHNLDDIVFNSDFGIRRYPLMRDVDASNGFFKSISFKSYDDIMQMQELLKYFINIHTRNNSKNKKIISALETLDNINSQHITRGYSERVFDSKMSVIGPVLRALDFLGNSLDKDAITKPFATILQDACNTADIKRLSKYFSNTTRKLMLDSNQNLFLVQKIPDKKNFVKSILVDANLSNEEFGKRNANYLLSNTDLAVDTLRMLNAQAKIYALFKKNNIPICFPKINDEGFFRIKNAYPIATGFQEPYYLSEKNGKYVRTLRGTPITFEYTNKMKNIIITGAHAGGKTELIKNIGHYVMIGNSGWWTLSEEADIPLTNRIITHFNKSDRENKGSLESEIYDMKNIADKLQERDLLLVDEFLDTAKPEVAHYAEYPLLEQLASTPATIIIQSHRASTMEHKENFKFYYPILAKRDDGTFKPTYKFEEGMPDGKITSEHALQLWNEIKDGMSRY